MSEPRSGLIPPPRVVRAELARAVRQARRLRSLLRLSEKAELDRRFCEELDSTSKPHESRHQADGRGVVHG